MEPKDLLPKNKFDRTNLEKISALQDSEFAAIAADLLTWLKDYNWPISDAVLQILISRQELVVPHLAGVLTGKTGIQTADGVKPDTQWQYWILTLLVPQLKKDHQLSLKKDIENLAVQPNTNADTNEVIVQARECLKKCFTE